MQQWALISFSETHFKFLKRENFRHPAAKVADGQYIKAVSMSLILLFENQCLNTGSYICYRPHIKVLWLLLFWLR